MPLGQPKVWSNCQSIIGGWHESRLSKWFQISSLQNEIRKLFFVEFFKWHQKIFLLLLLSILRIDFTYIWPKIVCRLFSMTCCAIYGQNGKLTKQCIVIWQLFRCKNDPIWEFQITISVILLIFFSFIIGQIRMFRRTGRSGESSRPHSGALRLSARQCAQQSDPMFCRNWAIPENCVVCQKGEFFF